MYLGARKFDGFKFVMKIHENLENTFGECGDEALYTRSRYNRRFVRSGGQIITTTT